MRISIITFIVILIPYENIAQVLRITGRLQNETGQAIQSASITISQKNSDIILAYTFSDKIGAYSIVLKKWTDSLKLAASSLGFAKKELIIPAISSTYDFILETDAIVLKEVKIQTSPVWLRKDTINYNVLEFKQQQDRVIGDIVARLPGIEVSSTGQIKYNGKPINKYYIEGLDLLDDKYGVANNNIPAESVDKVQVLENHQPIRVLDSVSFSDRAALNIKLKNSAKVRLIGSAKLAIGVAPFLTEDEITGMLFKKKLQFINTYKYNNTGTDNTRELTSHNISEYFNAIQNGAVKTDLVSLAQPGNPSIVQKRYLFNNAHMVSVNQLLPLNTMYQLRINVAYVNDFQQEQSSRTTTFYLPADTVIIAEQNKYKSNLNLLQTDLSLIANTPKYYLQNNLKFQGWWSVERNKLITNNEINQQLSNPFFNIANDFRLIKTRLNYIQEWGSYFGYVSLPQQLAVQPGLYSDIVNNTLPYEGLIQQTALKTFYTDNYLSLRKKKSRVAAQYKIGFNIQSQNFLTDLLTEESGLKKSVADTFQNTLNWQRYRIYNENNWSYENSKWRLSFSLPLSYNKINYSDTVLKVKSGAEGLFVNPLATIMYQLSPRWNVNMSVAYSQGFGDIADISKGYVLKTYRNLSNNNVPLAKTGSVNLSASVTFRNPLKVIFFNAGIMVIKSKSNLLYSQQFNGNLETLTAFRQDNYTNRAIISGRFNKYVIDWKTSIGVNYIFGFGNQQQLQQNQVITFSNRNFSVGTAISVKLSSKLTTEYNGAYSTYHSKSQLQSSSSAIASANQTLSVNYYPSKKIILRAGAEHYFITTNFSSSANYYFADMSMRYKPKKSKIDYEIACQNLFNTKEFTTVLLLNNIETVSQYQIRPRQAIFKMSFSF